MTTEPMTGHPVLDVPLDVDAVEELGLDGTLRDQIGDGVPWTARRIIEHLRPAPVVEPPEIIVMQVSLPPGVETLRVPYIYTQPLTGLQTEFFDEYEDGDVLAVCPFDGCNSTEFYEVDKSERWNPMELDEVQGEHRNVWAHNENRYVTAPNPLAGLPLFTVSEGSDGDGYSTDRHICQLCSCEVTLPRWLQTEWRA